MIGYNTEQQLTDYAAARGVTLVTDAGFLLTRALDWLELQPFKGSKTDPEQPLEWPRNGDEDVPAKIATAQLVAALIYNDGNDLLEPIGQRILSESVSGAVAVTYSDKGAKTNTYPQLTALLADYVTTSGGMQFSVSRG
jgi:hypothetical protein